MIKGRKFANAASSSADLAKMMIMEFECAGNDIPPVNIRNSAQAAKEIDFLAEKIAEGVEWDEQVKAIKRGMGLVNGGALEFDEFSSKISNISTGLIAGSRNLRSTLVKQACLFIAQLVHNLQKNFAQLGEMIMPLSKQTTHGTLIIAESCKLAIFEIVKYCPKKQIFFSIIELSKSRANENRQISADSLILILNYWKKHIVEQYNDITMKTLRILLVDSQLEVRNSARIASKLFASKYTKFTDLFLTTLDSKTKSAVLAAEVPQGTPPIKETSSETSQKNYSPASPIEIKVSEHLLLSPRSPKSYVDEVRRQYKQKTEFKAGQKQSRLPYKKKPKKQVEKPSMIPVFFKSLYSRAKSPVTMIPKRDSKLSIKRRSNSVKIIEKTEEQDFNPKIELDNRRNLDDHSQKRKSDPVDPGMPPPRLGKKRASSPKKEFTPLRKSAILLEEGNEKAFIDQIHDYLESQKLRKLSHQMRYIVPGLLITLNCKTTDLSHKSLSLIAKLMELFPNDFRSSLQSMFEILFGGILDLTKENEELLDSLLKTMIKQYNPNDLITLILTQVPSVRLTKFTSSIIEKSDLSSILIAKKLVKLAVKHYNNCQEESLTILHVIAQQNRKALESFNTNDKNAQILLHSALEYADEGFNNTFKIETKTSIDSLISDVRRFLRNVSLTDFARSAQDFYQSLASAAAQYKDIPSDCEKLFALMIECIDQKGCDYFEILAESAMKNIEISNAKRLLLLVESRADAEKLVTFFTKNLPKSDTEPTLFIDELQVTIRNNVERMRPSARMVTKILCDYINHENIFVRKSIVFCIALLVKTYGDIAEQVTRNLELPKQRLISIYVNKLK